MVCCFTKERCCPLRACCLTSISAAIGSDDNEVPRRDRLQTCFNGIDPRRVHIGRRGFDAGIIPKSKGCRILFYREIYSSGKGGCFFFGEAFRFDSPDNFFKRTLKVNLPLGIAEEHTTFKLSSGVIVVYPGPDGSGKNKAVQNTHGNARIWGIIHDFGRSFRILQKHTTC